MAYYIEHISGWPQVFCKKSKRWLTARPLIPPFIIRLKNAWGVLTGKYDAIQFVSDLEKEDENSNIH